MLEVTLDTWSRIECFCGTSRRSPQPLAKYAKMPEWACKPDPVRASTRGDHSSRPGVAAGLQRPTRGLGRATLPPAPRGPGSAPLFGLAPGGVCRASLSPGCWCALTAPFHPYRAASRRPGGMFLWHCPRGHPRWALPSTPPCGVRTFLPRPLAEPPATTRPTPAASCYHRSRRGASRAGARRAVYLPLPFLLDCRHRRSR